MNLDLLKSALSGDVRKDVTRAFEDGRMVIFKDDLLLVEQEDGSMGQFHLGRYFTPQDGGLGGVKPYYVEVEG